MDLQLYSIEQMPRTVPLWDIILEDLGRPRLERVAAALGVGRSSVYRWNASGSAPRAVLLALFWLTRWGRSAVNTQAVNDAVMAVQLARSYREECNKLRALSPDELAWPVIEPANPLPLSECGETRTMRGKEGGVSELLVLRQAHNDQPPAQARARSTARAKSAPTPTSRGDGSAEKTACQGAGTSAPGRPTAPANSDSARSKAAKSEVARPGTPASASRPERPAQLGLAPQPPAPRAPARSIPPARRTR